MAQVYSFVDDNGVTRLLAEIHPDPAFNGGTITSELVIDTAATTGQALQLQGSRTSENDIFRIDYPHTAMVVDSDGIASISSDDNMEFDITGTGGSRGLLLVLATPSNNQVESLADASQAFAQVSNSAGVVIARMDTLTGLMTALNAAPADGALAAGQCCLWFDATNGAAKLMMKGKSANGTVVTGSVALA